MLQSFRQFSRWVVAAACLLLAGKVEETPKKCRDIVKVCQALLNEHQMAHFGSNPKEELTTHERVLLQTIKFDLQVEHPYARLLKFAKQLNGEKAKIEKLVQMAWTFVNDSLCTSLCLQWEPQAIAIAFIHLAGKLSKFDLVTATQSKTRSWWRQYLDTLDIHDLESICHQVLDIYGEEEKSGEESGTASESTQQPTPTSTPHQQHSSSTSSVPHPPVPPVYPLTPGTIVPTPQPPLLAYSTHYQQQPMGTTVIPQQSTQTIPLFGPPRAQTMTPQTNPPHPPSAPPGPAPANTPLAYSTLNVNVSQTTGQPLPGGVAPPTGSYQYPASYPTPGGTPRAATPPNRLLGLQPKSFATGANAYPIQSFNKVMSSFVGSGSGMVGVARPVGMVTAQVGGAPRGVGRGSVNSTPPRPPHSLPHLRSNLTPPPGYPTQTSLPGGGASRPWQR
jgi:hypothetical protein